MNLEAIQAILIRDVEELAAIIDELEPGYTVSKIEAQILKSKIKNLSTEVSALFETIASSGIGVYTQEAEKKADPGAHVDNIQPTTTQETVSQAAHSKKQPIKDLPESTRPSESKLQRTEKHIDNLSPAISVPKPTITENTTNVHQVTNTPPKIEVDEGKKPLDTPARVTLADKFTETNRSLNDRIGQSKALIDRASMLGRKPITDIHKAIKINDRIGFIRELFNGDAALYQKTIDTINHLSNFDETLRYIHENFAWDQETEVFKNFIEVVYRRFMQ